MAFMMHCKTSTINAYLMAQINPLGMARPSLKSYQAKEKPLEGLIFIFHSLETLF